MRPDLVIRYPVDRSMRYAEHFRNGRLVDFVFEKLTDLTHVVWRQLRSSSELGSLVSVVIGSRADSEMSRVTARRIVARMKNLLSGWNRPAGTSRVDRSVGSYLAPVVVYDDAVTVLVLSASPRPTLIFCAHSDAGFNSVCDRNTPGSISARDRAVATLSRLTYALLA